MARKKKKAEKAAPAPSPVDFTTAAVQNGPLMALPAELQNRIFRYVLDDTKLLWTQRSGKAKKKAAPEDETPPIDPGEVEMSIPAEKPWANDGKPQPPGFLIACKTIYKDQIPVLYGFAKFEFVTVIALSSFVKTVSDTMLKILREVSKKRMRLYAVCGRFTVECSDLKKGRGALSNVREYLGSVNERRKQRREARYASRRRLMEIYRNHPYEDW